MPPADLPAQLLALQNADLTLRNQLLREGKLNDGYHPDMADLHRANADKLSDIIDTLGDFPTAERVGEEAAEAAWLVVQHGIGQPDFMRHCRDLLETAVAEGRADPVRLAYLSDRIAVFEGRPQRYGTQFDWDAEGLLSSRAYDDADAVNRRRVALGLNTLAEQTELMRRQSAAEGASPPKDMAARQRQYERWRREVGWIGSRKSNPKKS